MASSPAAKPRKRAAKVTVEQLRQAAIDNLKELLDNKALSAADLLRVIALDGGEAAAAEGDFMLVLREDGDGG
jgi:hypothetical protein